MIRIAIPPIGGPHWLGGWNYMVNMTSALAASGRENVETLLFLGEDIAPDRYAMLAALPRTRIIVSPVFDAAAKTKRLAQALSMGIDAGARDAFVREGATVVFEPATFFGWRLPLPVVAWLPDFQHLRMPHLFTRMGRLRRDIGFRAQIASGRTIMVSSADAERDALAGYRGAQGRTRVVRFAVRPPAPAMAEDAAARLIAAAGVSAPFAILPNQIWAHKNHIVVIEALARAIARGSDLTVVAPGAAHDPRAPDLADRLRRRIAELDLADRFLIPGMIPADQLQALMQGAIGLINPSRFEGWSTPVEEAKSRGMRMLLSDIPVHREQASNAADFFGLDDAAGLAALLIDLERSAAPVDAAGFDRARAAAAVAHRTFGQELATVFAEAAGDYGAAIIPRG